MRPKSSACAPILRRRILAKARLGDDMSRIDTELTDINRRWRASKTDAEREDIAADAEAAGLRFSPCRCLGAWIRRGDAPAR